MRVFAQAICLVRQPLRCPRRQDFVAHSWPKRRLDDWLTCVRGRSKRRKMARNPPGSPFQAVFGLVDNDRRPAFDYTEWPEVTT
jgi:hypothetical protein